MPDSLLASDHKELRDLKAKTIADSLRRTLRILVGATLVLYILLFALGWKTFQESRRNTEALCTFRGDLQKRVSQSEAFVNTHPQGFAGISAASIRVQINGQKKTIESLSGLHCPPSP